MRDFKYRELLLGKPEWEAVLSKINGVRSECLKECATAFAINLTRMATFAFMPTQLAFMVRRDQIFYDNAIFKITGKGDIKLLDFLKDPPAGVRDEAVRQMGEFIASMTDEEIRLLTVKLGIKYVEALLNSHQMTPMQDSVDAIFASTVLGSWTAFETFASDLWAVGVDKGPKEIAGALFTTKLPKSEEALTADKLRNLDNDVRISPGSFLKETGQVSFQKLELIRRYYVLAFGDEFKTLFDDTADGYICALSAIRNVLTHRAGIADKKFVEQTAGRFTEFKEIKPGQPILLDGELVQKLKLSAAKVGAELIVRIDNLLSPLP
jgi:hypothetical protein